MPSKPNFRQILACKMIEKSSRISLTNHSRMWAACKVKTQQKVCFITENTIYGGTLNIASGSLKIDVCIKLFENLQVVSEHRNLKLLNNLG